MNGSQLRKLRNSSRFPEGMSRDWRGKRSLKQSVKGKTGLSISHYQQMFLEEHEEVPQGTSEETLRKLEEQIQDKDNQIAELQTTRETDKQSLGGLREQLHEAEKQAILADELSADKDRLQQQLEAKDAQIEKLQQALDQNQQLLAYAQLPWWRKLGRKALPPAPEFFVDMPAEDEEVE